MLELLRSIPGPQFLFIFPLIAFAAIMLGRRLINSLGSGNNMPEPSAFPPAVIAALRGDWELVLKTAIFGMWQRGEIELVQIDGGQEKGVKFLGITIKSARNNRGDMILRRVAGVPVPGDRLDAAIWKFLSHERKPEEFFKEDTLKSYVDTQLKTYREKLVQAGLLKSPAGRRFSWIVFASMTVPVIWIGLAKLELGLKFGMPSIFLLIMLPFVLLALLIGIRPYEKLTGMGKQYLKRLEQHFAWMQDAVKSGEKPAVDPAYAFAIFGTAVLAGTLLYSTFCEAFPSQTSGGCGGGSCGGGSCSGGGCSGGGGCGGCGGGGD